MSKTENDLVQYLKEFITEERPTGGAAIRTLGDDYMTGVEGGPKTPLPNSPEINKLALKKVQEDETGITTMESAISDIVDTEFGQMNTAWRTSFYNKIAFEDVTRNNKIDDLVINTIYVNEAPTFIRFRARAKGRGARI